jgi:hypothetical protein
MKKIFTLTKSALALIMIWVLIVFTSCSSSKSLRQTSVVKDSSSTTAVKTTIVKRTDSAFHNYGKISQVKSDKGSNRTKEKERNTEITTTEYRLLHVATKAGDYLGPDLTRLNDSLVAERRTTTKKLQQKSKTVEQQKDKADSIGIIFIQGGDLSKVDSTSIDTTSNITTHSDTEVKVLLKKTTWWSWWYLLIIPVLYGLYRWAKNKSFLTKIFP